MIQNTSQNIQSTKDFPYSVHGRFGRLSYLAWLFITSVLYSCALVVVTLLGLITVATYNGEAVGIQDYIGTGLGVITLIALIIVIIGAAVLSIIVSIRRLHDLNKSGWLCLLFLLPIVNIIFGFYLMLAPGTQATNNYGPVRITEQTEKLIGILYCIFLATIFVLYIGALTFSAALMTQYNDLQQNGLTENSIQLDQSSIENDAPASEPTI